MENEQDDKDSDELIEEEFMFDYSKHFIHKANQKILKVKHDHAISALNTEVLKYLIKEVLARFNVTIIQRKHFVPSIPWCSDEAIKQICNIIGQSNRIMQILTD
ncbi:unnamed protein product [Rhizophagus irregularis]|nr:unnamed protein product [Rhizophagus irregularis]